MKKRGKKGQFYLVTTIMIIAIILGFVSLTNFVQKRSTLKFYYEGEELSIESEKVLDYILVKNYDSIQTKNKLSDFVDNYTEYSNADNFYFLFGESTELTFKGYQKLKGGEINISSESDINGEIIPMTMGEFSEIDLLTPGPGKIVKITIKEDNNEKLEFDFNLTEGTNFYYIVSREIGGDRYLETNA